MVKTCLECSQYFSTMHLYMSYIVVKFQTLSYNTFGDFFLVKSVQMDRWKAMHISPPCICTGVFNKT